MHASACRGYGDDMAPADEPLSQSSDFDTSFPEDESLTAEADGLVGSGDPEALSDATDFDPETPAHRADEEADTSGTLGVEEPAP